MPGYVPAPPPAAAGVAGLVGSLVLINVNGYNSGIQTQFGVKDEIDITVTVVDNPQNPMLVGTVLNTKAWNVNLISQLRNLVGQTTLGRLVMGQARNGNNAPIQLDPPTAQDQETADKFLANNPPLAAPAAPALSGPPPGYPAGAAGSGPLQPVGGPGAVPPAGYPPAPPGGPYGAVQPGYAPPPAQPGQADQPPF